MKITTAAQVADTVLGIGQSYVNQQAVESDIDYAKSIYGVNDILNKSANEFAVKRLEDRQKKQIAAQMVIGVKNGAMFNGSRAHVAVDTIKEYNLDIFSQKFKYKLQEFETNVAQRDLDLQKKNAKTKFISDTFSQVFSFGIDMAKGYAGNALNSGAKVGEE